MKQFISHQQYQELDEDLRIEWSWIILRHMIEHFDKEEIKNVDYEDVHRHTTIGQMIEFLEDHIYKIEKPSTMNGWTLSLKNGHYWWNDELCNNLWESVKEVLKQEK